LPPTLVARLNARLSVTVAAGVAHVDSSITIINVKKTAVWTRVNGE